MIDDVAASVAVAEVVEEPAGIALFAKLVELIFVAVAGVQVELAGVVSVAVVVAAVVVVVAILLLAALELAAEAEVAVMLVEQVFVVEVPIELVGL